jgi:hypothetical protein
LISFADGKDEKEVAAGSVHRTFVELNAAKVCSAGSILCD